MTWWDSRKARTHMQLIVHNIMIKRMAGSEITLPLEFEMSDCIPFHPE